MKKLVPTYDLYGERFDNGPDFWLHCETIPSRSSLHHWEIGLHRHESFFQILYISRGSGDAVFEGRSLSIVPPAVVTVPPRVGHGFRFSRDIDGFIFTLLTSHLRVAPGERSRFGAFLAEPRVTALPLGDGDALYIGETLTRLATEWGLRNRGRTDLMEAYVTAALALTARLIGGREAGGPVDSDGNERRVERLASLVHQHFRSHKPAAFYARELGITPTHLNRVVRSVTGQSVRDFIARKLTDEIKRELVFSQESAQEIAFRLGFTDPAYFSRFFLRQTGKTPRGWREAERAKRDPAARTTDEAPQSSE
ncbi:helix-turn-helix domain-containing protein [Sinorhizobium sp. BG8]|uniref:helix-turn-helix domain-containing protein n=1 Tax=Sinorhizobium sp. BG8 TaxID=2613773 RepID=UPI00193D0A61|nr:helix-turn-helix domain-containing protein [Sinorhizobium sp. BG8]QRM53944.1 helix-turn-helix domain-containing protein [Sinorhizobium sp. BG8]